MSPHSHEAVLLVEDDRHTREAIRTLLELEGFRVETAENGQDGLQRLRAGLRPCVIVLDMMMPVKGGAEFRREQLEDPQLADIPVVVYSGHDPAIDGKELAGAAYVKKPIDFDVLLNLVRLHC